MLLKKREMPFELQVLSALRGRVDFTPEWERQLRYAGVGYKGETEFDSAGEGVDDCVVRLNDVSLEVGGRLCQIDALYICRRKIYLFEIKNWAGAYVIQDGEFTGLGNCPLAQLRRTHRMLEEWLRRFGFQVQIETRLVFVGTEVTLFGLQAEDPIVLPHQLPDYFREIRNWAGDCWTEQDLRLGQRLLASHMVDNPYRKVAEYDAASVSPGILCPECRLVMIIYDKVKLQCTACGMIEFKRDSLQRTIAELDILFSPSKHRLHQIHTWCDGMLSKLMIFNHLRRD